MRPFNFYLILFLIILPICLPPVTASPPPNKPIQNTFKVKKFINTPLNEIEEKLDKKLKWHEKLALKSYKRKLKKQAKKNPNILEKELTSIDIANGKTANFNWFFILIGVVLLMVLIIHIMFAMCERQPEGCF